MAFSSFARNCNGRHVAFLSGGLGYVLDASRSAKCEEIKPATTPTPAPTVVHTSTHTAMNAASSKNDEELYANLFPKRQLYVPKKEYPLWDANWDNRQPVPLENKDEERRKQRLIRKSGTTRHIILIRHGQYDETHKEDEKRTLTKLGQEQADLTGKRIAEMIRGEGGDSKFTPCRVKVLRVSNMTRAKETADIIARHLDGVEREEPDPLLNEARPCHTIPGSMASPSTIQKTDEGHQQVEAAFQKYFFRSDYVERDDDGPTEDNKDSPENHEFEIIVCHANVIRYFLCRALQLPPEAWLRFCNLNCSLTYLTIRPTGSVSCRMFGDIGHLPYSQSTFSHHHGYNW